MYLFYSYRIILAFITTFTVFYAVYNVLFILTTLVVFDTYSITLITYIQ